MEGCRSGSRHHSFGSGRHQDDHANHAPPPASGDQRHPRSTGAEAFAKLVSEKTGGNVAVNIAGSEQLGNDTAMLTSLRTGALDITANSQGAASGLVPELATLGLPFLFDDSAAAFRVLDGPIGAELGEKFV